MDLILTRKDMELLEENLNHEGHQLMKEFRQLIERAEDYSMNRSPEGYYAQMIDLFRQELKIRSRDKQQLGLLKNDCFIGILSQKFTDPDVQSSLEILENWRWIRRLPLETKRKQHQVDDYGSLSRENEISILINNYHPTPLKVKINPTLEIDELKNSVTIPPGKRIRFKYPITKDVSIRDHQVEIVWGAFSKTFKFSLD